jgi:hypothetical protein
VQSADSEGLPPPDSTEALDAPPHNLRGYRWIRAALLVFHITVVVAAMSLTPDGYFFQLGEITGTALILTSVILWCFLFFAKTRRAITIFCVLTVGQAGCTAVVALHFRAEDKALKPIFEEIVMKRSQWESQIGQFRMDPLFEMVSGKSRLSVAELRELQTRARMGKAKIAEVQSEEIRSVAEAELRIGRVSHEAARDFERGFESTRPASEEQMKLMQDYFTATEQLAEFLIHRQKQYSQTPQGLAFTRSGDAEAFDKQLDAIAHLQKQINSIRATNAQNTANVNE